MDTMLVRQWTTDDHWPVLHVMELGVIRTIGISNRHAVHVRVDTVSSTPYTRGFSLSLRPPPCVVAIMGSISRVNHRYQPLLRTVDQRGRRCFLRRLHINERDVALNVSALGVGAHVFATEQEQIARFCISQAPHLIEAIPLLH